MINLSISSFLFEMNIDFNIETFWNMLTWKRYYYKFDSWKRRQIRCWSKGFFVSIEYYAHVTIFWYLKSNHSCTCIYYVSILKLFLQCQEFSLKIVLLHDRILHGYFMHFQLGGVCFISKRRNLLLLPNGRRLFPKNWRNVFPKCFGGVCFHCEASASNGPTFLRLKKNTLCGYSGSTFH